MLMVLGRLTGSRRSAPPGEGGNVLNGGTGDGRCTDVYRGSKRMEEGVESCSRIFSAASFDPFDAVMSSEPSYWKIQLRLFNKVLIVAVTVGLSVGCSLFGSFRTHF